MAKRFREEDESDKKKNKKQEPTPKNQVSEELEKMTLYHILKGNAAKELFFKSTEDNKIVRFAPPFQKFILSYSKKVIALRKQGKSIKISGKFGKNIIFAQNLFDQVEFKRTPIELTDDDNNAFKLLAEFIKNLMKSYDFVIPREIESLLDLLRKPKIDYSFLLNHFSLWSSGKRQHYVESILHLYEQPTIVADPEIQPPLNQISLENKAARFRNIVKSGFENPNVLHNYLEGEQNFWEVWGDDVIMKDNYLFFDRKQAQNKAERKTENQRKQFEAMSSKLSKASTSQPTRCALPAPVYHHFRGRGAPPHAPRRPGPVHMTAAPRAPQAPPMRAPLPLPLNVPLQNPRSRSGNFYNYKNTIGELLRFQRNAYEHYRIDTKGKLHTFVDIEWHFFMHFPWFLFEMCSILASVNLFPRIS